MKNVQKTGVEMLTNEQFQERFSNRRPVKLHFKKKDKTRAEEKFSRKKFVSLKELKKV